MNERLDALLKPVCADETSRNGVVRMLENLDSVELVDAIQNGEVEVGDNVLPVTSSVTSLAEMLDGQVDFGPPETVADRIAWRGRVTGIFAREKTGKSTFMTWVASCLTNCLTMLGWKPAEAGRVLWFGP